MSSQSSLAVHSKHYTVPIDQQIYHLNFLNVDEIEMSNKIDKECILKWFHFYQKD